MLFRVGFEKDVWLLVSCLRGWFMARQEQQQQHQQMRAPASPPPEAAAADAASIQQQEQQEQQQQQCSLGPLCFAAGRCGSSQSSGCGSSSGKLLVGDFRRDVPAPGNVYFGLGSSFRAMVFCCRELQQQPEQQPWCFAAGSCGSSQSSGRGQWQRLLKSGKCDTVISAPTASFL